MLGNDLGGEGGAGGLEEGRPVGEGNGGGHLGQDLDSSFRCTLEALGDHSRMDTCVDRPS